MDTYFANPERSDSRTITDEVKFVGKSFVLSGLLDSLSGLLTIVNENRQIVAINNSFLTMLGIDNPEKVFGLRPGEALNCIHADETPAKCGTTPFCSTCGAAISMVSSLEQNRPVESRCALSAKKGEGYVNMVLLVKSHPIEIGGKRFLMLFFQDITKQEQKAALERTFFHDINNLVGVLLNSSDMLYTDTPSDLAKVVYNTSVRLKNEIAIQRTLSESQSDYLPLRYDITAKQIIDDLKTFFYNHPAGNNKNIWYEKLPDISIKTDTSLLSRILCNMMINALEATEIDGSVKIWIEKSDDYLTFCVWNLSEIPEDIKKRIFQRNFSTKNQEGRGIGTYSMKLFGEDILGGSVSFTSSPKGTIFKFSHPI